MTKKSLSILLAAVLILSLFTIASAPVAGAGGSLACFGQTADIQGGPGNNTINGTAADEVIAGGGGDDKINGGGGHDIICGGSNSTVNDGEDTIRGGSGNDTIFGNGVTGNGDGDDFLFGGPDRDNLFGQQGQDVLDGGGNAPGVGDEANFWFANNPVKANLNSGFATGEGGDELMNIEGLGGSSNDDKLTGDEEANSLDGGLGFSGHDVLKGMGGDDTVSLTFVNNQMYVNLQGGTMFGDGNDILSSVENVVGSPYHDYITGTESQNVLFGGDGNDTMFGRGGEDVLIGFQGADTMFGGAGIADFVSYSDAPNLAVNVDLATGSVTRSDGNDTLDGIEMLEGSDQNDNIYGDNGANFFYADEGDDLINGRGGSDLVFFLGAGPGGVDVDLGEGTATGMNDSGPDVLVNIEHAVGSSYSDELIGDGNRNFLNGSSRVDHVVGAGNNDYISGGSGDDLLEGGPGNQDMVDFFQSKNGVNLDLGSGEATGEGTDELIDIEAASGSKKGDRFEGDSAANFFYGQKGPDDLLGLGGGDHLDGGPKTDSLVGGPANDECFTKSESSSCEDFSKPDEHPLSSYSRRYKKAVAAARRYKRRYK